MHQSNVFLVLIGKSYSPDIFCLVSSEAVDLTTIFSMIKRKCDDALRAKLTKTQIQEGYHKLLT